MTAAAESLGQPDAGLYALHTADGSGFTLLHRCAQCTNRCAISQDHSAVLGTPEQP